jgi:hypothetical protein
LGTLDNWGDTLFAAMDITGLDQQPRQNAEWQNAIFFIVFVCVSAHFMIKSFVAVFCDQVGPLCHSSASSLVALILMKLPFSFAITPNFYIFSEILFPQSFSA